MDLPGRLRDEHWEIERMLDVLRAVARRLQRGAHIDRDMLMGLLGFFTRYYADCHQLEEERALFPLIAARAPEPDRRMTRDLVRQHRADRVALVDLTAIVDRLLAGDPAAVERFAALVAAFAPRLLDHIAEEDRLYRRIAPLIAPAEQESLERALDGIERERLGATGREWYRQVVADYADIVSTWPEAHLADAPPWSG
jgi:hemerythrin-like domain-containing protein